MSDQKWAIRAALCSGKGCVRPNNEDNYYFNGEYHARDKLDEEIRLVRQFDKPGVMLAVCDGMGGLAGGETAAYQAVTGMDRLHKALRREDFRETVEKWASQMNERVVQNGGGATMAMLYVGENSVASANIGDSRIYRLHDGRLAQLSKDHTKVKLLMEAGLIDALEAQTHPHRHMLTRFLGMREENGACVPTVQRPMPLQHGDRYLICSDGVTDMLSDDILEQLMNGIADTDACAEGIYRETLASGGHDNTTLIVVDVLSKEEKQPDRRSGMDTLDRTEVPDGMQPPRDRIVVTQTIRTGEEGTVEIKAEVSGVSRPAHITVKTQTNL